MALKKEVLQQPAGQQELHAVRRTNPIRLTEAAREFLRYGSPRILIGVVICLWTARIIVGGGSLKDGLVAALLLALWPFQEWFIHNGLLHAAMRESSTSGRPKSRLARVHWEHHHQPWRLELVFIPASVYLYSPLMQGLLWFALFPNARALTALSVSFSLSLFYEWVHFLMHTRYVPRNGFCRRLWRNHRLHHFKNENFWYGVSALSGDRLFGTTPDHRKTELSALCKSLSASAEQPE
jgi:fatty acid hydroxylase family protein